MVIGLGSDLVEIERVRRSVERFGERFLERVYTPAEIAYCMTKRSFAESFAARFAAKEAGAKALGTGISRGVGWKDFEVKRAARISLSLTHSRELAMAVVAMEGQKDRGGVSS